MRFQSLIDPEWKRMQPFEYSSDMPPELPEIVWLLRVSPAFPAHWPPRPGAPIYYYVYAGGRDTRGGLSDGEYLAAVWARIEVARESGSQKFERLADEIRKIGIQGVRPLTEEEIKVYASAEQVEDYLIGLSGPPDEKSQEAQSARRFYQLWIRLNGIVREIRPLHADFFVWVGGESEE